MRGQGVACAGAVTVLCGIQHIKIHPGNAEAFSRMGLIIAHIGKMSGDSTEMIGGTVIDIKIVDHIFQVKVLMICLYKTGKAPIMVCISVADGPGTDDHSLPLRDRRNFTAEVIHILHGPLAHLVVTATVLDIQAVVRHTDDVHCPRIVQILGVARVCESPSAFLCGDRIHIDLHRQLSRAVIAEALYCMVLGVHNDPGLAVGRRKIGIDAVTAVLIKELSVQIATALGRDGFVVHPCIATACELAAVAVKLRGACSCDDTHFAGHSRIMECHRLTAIIAHPTGRATPGIRRHGDTARSDPPSGRFLLQFLFFIGFRPLSRSAPGCASEEREQHRKHHTDTDPPFHKTLFLST